MKKFLIIGCLLFSGCIKPYHEATLVDIGTSEVAILVETINDNGQAVISPNRPEGDESTTENGEIIDFYKNRVVNARKVEIPYYWKQTKRVFLYQDGTTGEWQPAARLIVVDTSPETREWSSSINKGTSQKDQGIWVESKDSVGFSTGISITARIENQEDAILYLSNYKPRETKEIQTSGGQPFFVEITSLDQIMDEEIRTKIQEVYAYESADSEMDDLRSKKREIMDKVKEEVVPFFKERGITITTIGQFGGFTYENPESQKSIDLVFQSQQDKQVAIAESEAAEERKIALKLKGEGEGEQILQKKLKEAEGIQAIADAKAYELQKLQENPEAYLALKQIEVELAKLEKWDGSYPSYLFQGGGEKQQLLLNLPGADNLEKTVSKR